MWGLFTIFELYFAFFYFNDVSGRGSSWIHIVINSVHNTFDMLFFTNRENRERIQNMWVFSQERSKFRPESSQWNMPKLSTRNIEFPVWLVPQKCSFLVNTNTLKGLLRAWKQEENRSDSLERFRNSSFIHICSDQMFIS